MNLKFALLNSLVILVACLQLFGYYYRPSTLPTFCSTGKSHEDPQEIVVDCITCFDFDQKWPNFGQDYTGTIKVRLPSNQTTDYQFVSHLYVQQNCMEYQCAALSYPDDFLYKQQQHGEIMNELTFKVDPKKAPKKGSEYLSSQLMALFDNFFIKKTKYFDTFQLIQYFQGVSNAKGAVSSIALRFRYTVDSPSKSAPDVTYHYTTGCLYYRLIFSLLMLLEVVTLHDMLNRFPFWLKYLLSAVFFLCFSMDFITGIASLACMYFICKYYMKASWLICLLLTAAHMILLLLAWSGSEEYLFCFNISLVFYFITAEMDLRSQKCIPMVLSLEVLLATFTFGWYFAIDYIAYYSTYLILILLLIRRHPLASLQIRSIELTDMID